MPIVLAKCTECGGTIKVDSEKKLGVCENCGEPFVVEDAINNFTNYYTTNYITNNNTTHNYGDGAVVNIYEKQNKDFDIEGGVLKAYHGETLDVVIPDGVVSIGERCFKEMNITSVIFPSSLKTVKFEAFSGCRNLKNVSGTDNIEEIEPSAFEYCINLKTFTATSAIRIVSTAFKGCHLSELTISNLLKFDNSIPNIHSMLPGSLGSLYNVSIDKLVVEYDEHSDKSFGITCETEETKINELIINEGIETITGLAGNYDYIQLPKSATIINAKTIKFINVKKELLSQNYIKEIILNDISLDDEMDFSVFSKLTSVLLSECENLYGNVFDNVENLKTVIAPKLKRIGNSGFSNCRNLQTLTVSSAISGISVNSFNNCPKLCELIIVYNGEFGRPLDFDYLKHINLGLYGLKKVLIKDISTFDEKTQSDLLEFINGYGTCAYIKHNTNITVNNIIVENAPEDFVWRMQGKCRYCGGEIKIRVFKKNICKQCNKEQDD